MSQLHGGVWLLGYVVLLGGCVHHDFVPGPGMSALDFEPDSANCRIWARQQNPGRSFEAYGSQQFVAASLAGAALGGAVADAVQENANFNDCMEGHGWRVADAPAPVADAPVPVVPEPLPPPRPAAFVTTSTLAAMAASPAISRRAARLDLNIRVEILSGGHASALGIAPPRGLLVTDVVSGGAGANAGLAPGDVILGFGGEPVASIEGMQRKLTSVTGGSIVPITIWRSHRKVNINLEF